MHDVGAALSTVRARIGELERRYRREPGSVAFARREQDQAPGGGAGRDRRRPASVRRESPPGRDDQGRGARRQRRLLALHRRCPIEQDPADRGAFRLGARHRAREDRGPPLRPAPRRPRAARRLHRGQRERRGHQVGCVPRGSRTARPGHPASCPGCGCAASWLSPAPRRTSSPNAPPSACFARSSTTSMRKVSASTPSRWA